MYKKYIADVKDKSQTINKLYNAVILKPAPNDEL